MDAELGAPGLDGWGGGLAKLVPVKLGGLESVTEGGGLSPPLAPFKNRYWRDVNAKIAERE